MHHVVCSNDQLVQNGDRLPPPPGVGCLTHSSPVCAPGPGSSPPCSAADAPGSALAPRPPAPAAPLEVTKWGRQYTARPTISAVSSSYPPHWSGAGSRLRAAAEGSGRPATGEVGQHEARGHGLLPQRPRGRRRLHGGLVADDDPPAGVAQRRLPGHGLTMAAEAALLQHRRRHELLARGRRWRWLGRGRARRAPPAPLQLIEREIETQLVQSLLPWRAVGSILWPRGWRDAAPPLPHLTGLPSAGSSSAEPTGCVQPGPPRPTSLSARAPRS